MHRSVMLLTALLTTTLLPDETDYTMMFPSGTADLYWDALVHIAKSDKATALKLVQMIKDATPAETTPAWKQDLPDDIDAFFDKLFLDTVVSNPQWLTELNLFESIGLTEHTKHLNDVTPDALRKIVQDARANLARLQHYAGKALTADQQLSLKIFAWTLDHTAAGEKFLLHEYKINQFDSILSQLSALFTMFHTIKTSDDAYNYITRLRKIPQQLAQTIEFMDAQQRSGVIVPRFALEKVITVITKSTPAQIDDNMLFENFVQRIKPLQLPEATGLMQEARRVLIQEVYPAYRMLQRYCAELLKTTPHNHGVWAQPDGDAYYTHMLKYHTTTNLSAEEIHQLGLIEVAKIHAAMRAILADEGIADENKPVGALVQELSLDERFGYSNDDAGRAQCLADYHTILERSRKELSHLFGLKPQAGVTIQRVPAHEEEGAPAAYYHLPSIDGSRPGTFFANLRDMDEIRTYGMETLTIHEAEPGHHFQLALQYEMNMPMLRKLASHTAHCEGWALYAEKLAYEHGFYSSSFAKLGHLQDELLRAARLVIDTGIHYKRWTREHAIAYMQEVTGYHYNSVVTEIERYFVLPGQACAYKIGQLKILELRQRAKDALGDKFDIREFHDVVLQTAAVPLTILEEVIDTYIARKLAE